MALGYLRPSWARRINYLGTTAGGAEQLVPLETDALIEQAKARAGLKDFGVEGWRDAMQRLVDEINARSRLNTLGRLMTRADLLRCLDTRLQLTDYLKRRSDLEFLQINRPIFIAGTARNGSTILHELLAQDPRLRAPLGWETAHPLPLANDQQLTREEVAECAFDLWADIQPEFDSIHELRSRLPAECLTIMAPEFTTGYWITVADIPEFAAWRESTDHVPGYRFHRRFLQVLQGKTVSERWLLRSAAHLSHFDAIFKVYSDATIIHLHRDPAKTVPSTVSAVAATRFLRCDEVDVRSFATDVAGTYQRQLETIIEQRRQGVLPEEQIVDLHYRDFIADPVSTIASIYPHLGLKFTDEIAQRMRTYLQQKPKGKHGSHVYSAQESGLDEGALSKQFAPYMKHYGVAREV